MCLVTQNGAEVCLHKVTSFLPEGHRHLVSLPLDTFRYGLSVAGESKLAISFRVCSSKYGISMEGKRMDYKEVG